MAALQQFEIPRLLPAEDDIHLLDDDRQHDGRDDEEDHDIALDSQQLTSST